MSTVRVRLEDYVAGTLPDVSVLSGAPTTDRVVVTSEVVPSSLGGGRIVPFLLHRLEQLLRPGAARIVVKGRVPMTNVESSGLHRQRRWCQVTRWVAFLVLIGAGLSEAPAAPAIAVAAILAIVAATHRLVILRRRWPHARPAPDPTWVVLDRVHDAFVAAVTTGSEAEVGEP